MTNHSTRMNAFSVRLFYLRSWAGISRAFRHHYKVAGATKRGLTTAGDKILGIFLMRFSADTQVGRRSYHVISRGFWWVRLQRTLLKTEFNLFFLWDWEHFLGHMIMRCLCTVVVGFSRQRNKYELFSNLITLAERKNRRAFYYLRWDFAEYFWGFYVSFWRWPPSSREFCSVE